MKKTHLIALAIFGLVVLWLGSGALFRGDSEADGPAQGEEVMTVAVRAFEAEPFGAHIIIQGHTEAVRRVVLRAQTDGRVAELPVEKGERVKEGDPVCVLALDDRAAKLAEARALAAQRKLEFDASTELAAKGHRSPTQAAAAKAQYDAALALVSQMEVELSHTKIRAPFDGVMDQRAAEIGSYLQKGDACATVLDLDPYLVVGEASERAVSEIVPGMAANARLVDGTGLQGRIRYVATAGQTETRTFRVELEVPNPDLALKDGMTAEIHIPTAEHQAHRLPTSTLVLNDQGVLGVRIVENEVVRFVPVTIIGDAPEGAWVSGLAGRADVITVGQQFVKSGQRVQTKPDQSYRETSAP